MASAGAGTAGVASAAVPAGAVVSASAAVRELPQGRSVGPGDPRYQTLSQGFNQRWSSQPAYIRLVGNETDAVVELARALDQGLRPTIRGGGHCYEGFVDNDGGVILDLSTMRGVEEATDKYGGETYSVGAAPPTGTSTPHCSASSPAPFRPGPATRSARAGTSAAAGTACSPGGTG
jgi:hypothetical protein